MDGTAVQQRAIQTYCKNISTYTTKMSPVNTNNTLKQFHQHMKGYTYDISTVKKQLFKRQTKKLTLRFAHVVEC